MSHHQCPMNGNSQPTIPYNLFLILVNIVAHTITSNQRVVFILNIGNKP